MDLIERLRERLQFSTQIITLRRERGVLRGGLTLRRLGVLVRHLPVDSSTAMATGSTGWTLADHLLADVFHATAGKPHPGLPKVDEVSDPKHVRAIRDAKARARERQRAIDAGEII